MTFSLFRTAGFLCLFLALPFSGCASRVLIPATQPHVYSSDDPAMQAYESEEEEIERLRREIKVLKAKGSEKADIRKLRTKIRELESAIASYAAVSGENAAEGPLTLDQEFKAFLRENDIPRPYLWLHIPRYENGLDSDEDATEAGPKPDRVRFDGGPLQPAR